MGTTDSVLNEDQIFTGPKTAQILTPADLEEFEHNAKHHGSLCQAIRKDALSCEECKTHGPCRVSEFYDLKRATGTGQMSLNQFVGVGP